ncbi:RraA family protein [Devosia elaeis]|uniref:Putative 4-hydroxy-4-methyl-2-oxoglutarate aldolase n=1 Tax=Devosia elaeis TaxID=1770058 RepID=A0A178HKE2_9HYPH|nr:RraA family protein [Devosia elaeis]OAM72989.1 dimethylmenaquinone methyltransferase [Devosia elaeis]
MKQLPISDLLRLAQMTTPTVYNGWSQITRADIAREGFNREPTQDWTPQLGPMVGYAVTVVIEPSNARHRSDNPDALRAYRDYVASFPGPKIVVVQDLDGEKTVGSMWGEVNATLHRAIGCVGTIVDGAVRDIDEMGRAGFKAVSRRLCVGNAHVHPVRWNCDVEVFGTTIRPGQLVHADKHGFLAVPAEDEERLLEAAQFMDRSEFETVIAAAWNRPGIAPGQIVADAAAAAKEFRRRSQATFSREGEW